MATIRLEPGNPHDFTQRELEDLACEIQERESVEVEVRLRPERGYGVTFSEVLDVVMTTAETAADVGGAYAFFDLVVEWAKARWKRDRDEHDDAEPRPRAVTLYDAKGNPIRAVVIEAPDGEPAETEEPRRRATGLDAPRDIE